MYVKGINNKKVIKISKETVIINIEIRKDFLYGETIDRLLNSIREEILRFTDEGNVSIEWEIKKRD